MIWFLFGFHRRSDDTPETQLSRLLQLQAYYAYEDYHEHTLRDVSVLSIRDPKVHPMFPSLILAQHVQFPTIRLKYSKFFHLLCC